MSKLVGTRCEICGFFTTICTLRQYHWTPPSPCAMLLIARKSVGLIVEYEVSEFSQQHCTRGVSRAMQSYYHPMRARIQTKSCQQIRK